MKISETIKNLRAKSGLTQAEFGKIAGVSDKAVSTWENGTAEPRMSAIEKLAAHFKMTKTEIIDGPKEVEDETFMPVVAEDVYQLISALIDTGDANFAVVALDKGGNIDSFKKLSVNVDSIKNDEIRSIISAINTAYASISQTSSAGHSAPGRSTSEPSERPGGDYAPGGRYSPGGYSSHFGSGSRYGSGYRASDSYRRDEDHAGSDRYDRYERPDRYGSGRISRGGYGSGARYGTSYNAVGYGSGGEYNTPNTTPTSSSVLCVRKGTPESSVVSRTDIEIGTQLFSILTFMGINFDYIVLYNGKARSLRKTGMI